MRDFQLPGRSPVFADNAMAATSHPLATVTAMNILREGGNAVDAALAASATLCAVEPHMTGIGGDCFAIVAEADGRIHGLNASGRAGRAADPGWYRDQGLVAVPARGPLSVTVPGAVAGWEALAERFGTLGFDRLFTDAIRYAGEGYRVHPRVARDWALLVPDIKAAGAENTLLVAGEAPQAGQHHAWPQLARTLAAIARDGAKAFYEGEIARDMAETVTAAGGFLDTDDIASAKADWVDPISTQFGGHEVYEIPPNGQGITALILMNLLSEAGADRLAPQSGERYHLEIEAGRLAYSVRDHLVADPAVMTVRPEDLLSPGYTRRLAARIDPARRTEPVELPDHPRAGTVYLTVVDRDRMAVSFINSIYSGFGSMVVAEKSGVIMQNRGSCFSLQENHPNEIGPGKRPMHTIIPGMTFKDGKPAMSFGVMGGSFQSMGHAHVLSNMFLHGMDPQSALDHPRLFWGLDGTIQVERAIPAAVRDHLTKMGHRVDDAISPWGGGQVIELNRADGSLCGSSDFRKDGCVLGW